jgi:hypothetical protein
MKLLYVLSAILLTSCSTLRQGWIKADFLDGHPSPEVICQLKVNAEGDLEGRCVDLETVLKEAKKNQMHQREGEI